MPTFNWTPDCTMHDTIENGTYPYRCQACNECRLCGIALPCHVTLSTAGPSGTAEPESPKGITQYLKDLFYPAIKAKVDEFTE